MTDASAADSIRHLVILGHPSERSLNRAIAAAYCAAVRERGQLATLRDLYALGFDPVRKPSVRPETPHGGEPEMQEEIRRVNAADAIVLVYPVWLGGPPAILKGYLDRVLGAGYGEGRPHPAGAGKPLLTLSTSEARDAEGRAAEQAMRAASDRCLAHALRLAGTQHVHFDAVLPRMPGSRAMAVLEQARAAAHSLCGTLDSRREAGAK